MLSCGRVRTYARSANRVCGRSGFERGSLFFDNQFDNPVIVRSAKLDPLRLDECDTGLFGLLAGTVEADYFSGDPGQAQVEIASSGHCAELIGYVTALCGNDRSRQLAGWLTTRSRVAAPLHVRAVRLSPEN